MVVDQRVREGYKMTELGEIPVEWTIKKLDDISLKITDGSHTSPKEIKHSKYKICTVKHMKHDGFDMDIATNICEEDFVRLVNNGCKPEFDDVLLSKDGTIGKTFVFKQKSENIVLLSSIAIIRGNKNIIVPEFLKFYFENPKTILRVTGMKSGSAIKRIVLRDIKNLAIVIPNISEQQKIAEILSAVDEQIENTDQLIEKTKELKKGLMQQLLTKGIGHTEFKMTEIGEIPVEWEVKPQGEIATFYNGRAYKQAEFRTEGTPIVRIQNLTGEREPVYSDFELEENKYIDNGDLIYAWSATFGPFIWKGPKSIYHYHIWKVEVEKQLLDKTFFYYRLDYISNEMNSQKNGSAFSHLTKSGMESHKIALPSLKEQQKIAEILSTVDEQIESYEQEKEKYTELKKGLMQQLLTGKIRVTV